MLTRSHASYATACLLRPRSSGVRTTFLYKAIWSSGKGVAASSSAAKSYDRAGDDGRKSGTILVRNGAAIRQESFISAVTPVQRWSNPLNSERDVVLLVSKGLSHWLNAENNFLHEVLSKLLTNHIDSNLSQINVLLAVVDRIPAPSNALTDGKTSGSVSTGQDFGFEGLAYRVEDGQHLLRPDDTTERPAHNSIRDRNRPFEGPPGAIQFRFVEQTHEDSPTSLEVALANTIFTTATRRILRRSTWTLPFRQSHFRDLESAIVKLPSSRISKLTTTSTDPTFKADMPDATFGLDVPLIPLTPRRIISDCMGNVVRGIKDAKEGASKELEDAVTRYFEDTGKDPMTAAVWAVIIPENLVDDIAPAVRRVALASDEADNPVFEQPLVPGLWRGATLRKVISGGGGWGDKAGLLSLDHDTGVSPTTSRSNNNNMELDLDTPDFANLFSHKRLVDDIAIPGDSIQFFIAPENRNEAGMRSTYEDAEHSARLTSLDFGVIPVATEALETGIPSSVPGDAENITEVYSGHFGALSEVGLGLRRQLSGLHKTKIDVPFSRFWYQQIKHVSRRTSDPHDESEFPESSRNGVKQKTMGRTEAGKHTVTRVSPSAATFASTFQGRSLNDVLGKQATNDSNVSNQTRQYSTRAMKSDDATHITNHFYLPTHTHQVDGRVPRSRDDLQTRRTGARGQTASEQAPGDSPTLPEHEHADSAHTSLKVQRTSSKSALDVKGAFRLAKANASPSPAVHHVLPRKGYEVGQGDPKISAQHHRLGGISRGKQDVDLIQPVVRPLKYDPGIRIRKHGVLKGVRKVSASRPTALADSDSPGSPRSAPGPSSTKHSVSKRLQRHTLEGEQHSTVPSPLRRRQRHAADHGKSHLNAVTDPSGPPTTMSAIDNIEESNTHPRTDNASRIYVAGDIFKALHDRRIATRNSLKALHDRRKQSTPEAAPLRKRSTNHSPIRVRRLESERVTMKPYRDQDKKTRRKARRQRRATKIRKHIVDKSDLFASARLQAERAYHIAMVRRRQEACRLMNQPDIVPDLPRFSNFGKSDLFDDYDALVRKTVPKKMPRYPSKLLSIPELMRRRARARRNRQYGSTRMVRTVASTKLVRPMPSLRPARPRKVRSSYTIRKQERNSVYMMAARGNTQDKQKLQEIKAWLDARMASSSTMSGEDHAFKIEDWSDRGQATGRSSFSKPRSNRALDEIDTVFKDLYGR